MDTWRALLNLLRAAARDPLWRIFLLLMSPLRLCQHLVLTMLVYLAAGTDLIVFWHGIKRAPQKTEFKALQSERVASRKQ